MNHFTTLIAKSGNRTEISYDFKRNISEIAKSGDIDTLIISADGGYTPMNNNIDFLAKDLGYPNTKILGDNFKCCYKNSLIEIACVSPLRSGGSLKGVIVCPGMQSECYSKFSIPGERKACRDFFYAETYEAISYAVDKWGSERIGIVHLGGRNDNDVVKCVTEALGHFCDEYPRINIKTFAFVGCCLEVSNLESIKQLNPEGAVTKHIPISKTIYPMPNARGIDVIRIEDKKCRGRTKHHNAVISASNELPLEDAIKGVKIKNLKMDSKGIKISIPKGRMGELDNLFIFPELNPASMRGELTAQFVLDGMGELFISQYGNEMEFTVYMDNIFKWYLDRKNIYVGRKNDYFLDKMETPYRAGDTFVKELFDGIIKMLRENNSARLYHGSAVLGENGKIIEMNLDKAPLELAGKISYVTESAELSLTMSEFRKLVQVGGGDFKVKDGVDYLTQYSNRMASDGEMKSHRELARDSIIKDIMPFVKSHLEKYLGSLENKNQGSFGFDYVPDYSNKVEEILSGEYSSEKTNT